MSLTESIKETIEKVGALPMILRRLTEIANHLKTLADLYAIDLARSGYHLTPPKADTSGEPPEALYTDEERDYAREIAEMEGRKVE